MIENYIEQAFQEDIPQGDVTTLSLKVPEKKGIAQLIAKQDLVLSGTELFTKSLQFIDPTLKLLWHFQNGDSIYDKQCVCQIEGNLLKLIQAERVALNFLGYLSGIATTTSQYVMACEGTKTYILDTRKTLPLYRQWSKQAVVHGGGRNHRMNLSDAVLIKENHIEIAGDLETCLKTVQQNSKIPIELEVKNKQELETALNYNIHRVMLDNMTNEQMTECLKILPNHTQSEASGNMTLERIPSVAQLGVDFISVGALTHSVKNADFSLLFNWN